MIDIPLNEESQDTYNRQVVEEIEKLKDAVYALKLYISEIPSGLDAQGITEYLQGVE